MATFTLDELVTPITAAEFKASHYDALATVGVETATWKPGSPLRTIINVVSICLAALSVLVSNIARSGFLGLASGLWARAHARDVYKVEQLDAQYAQGYALVSNTGGGVYSFDPEDFEVENRITGAVYRNTAPITIDAGASELPVLVRAVEVGAASSALVGETTKVRAALPAAVTVTNAVTFIGIDAESEELLKVRAGEKLGSLSPNGPPDAYAFAARGATRADGSNVGVQRVRTRAIPGGIEVICATANGAVPGDAFDPSTDLGLVSLAVRRNALPQAVGCVVRSATPKAVPVTANVWVRASDLSEADSRAAIESELRAFFSSPVTCPIGGADGAVFASDLSATILRARTAAGASIQAFRAVITPNADVPISLAEVPTLGTVSLRLNIGAAHA